MRRVRRHARDLAVAVVLPAHVVGRVGRRHRAEERVQRVLERVRLVVGRHLHRGGADHLHEVVDHDVAQRADRVVEVPAVLDAEALGHRDLDRGEVAAVPDRLEPCVGEAQVEDLRHAHLPEEVVDAVQLGLVDVLVHLVGQRAGRLEVVAERLLDDDARPVGETRVGEALDDVAEEEGRDLEVEDRRVGVVDRGGQALEGLRVAEVAGDVGQTGREAVEQLAVHRLPGGLDRGARPLAQVGHRPVVDRDADDRAVEQAAAFEPVQRPEGHLLGEVAGDPEDDQDVGRPRLASRGRGPPRCARGV